MVTRSLAFTSNFPVPSPMITKGDQVNNWEFFRQQWTDYEVATDLETQYPKIRLATFRSIMGKDCLQIFLVNLTLTGDEERNEIMCQSPRRLLQTKKECNLRTLPFQHQYTCTQNTEETADGYGRYVNRLRKYASTCELC